MSGCWARTAATMLAPLLPADVLVWVLRWGRRDCVGLSSCKALHCALLTCQLR